MNIRSIAIAALALAATSAALAEAARPRAKTPEPAARQQTLVEELAVGMREVLRAVTPEISLPALELKLPSVTR